MVRNSKTVTRLPRHRLSRRALLQQATVAGLIGHAVGSGVAAAPGPRPAVEWIAPQRDALTLVIASSGLPSDLDPHSAYDYRSLMAILGAYEGLIGLVEDRTDEFEGLVAESWSANEDMSVWTFKIRPGITFHDGSPVDGPAVRRSFERLLTLGLGPVGVLARFVADPSQITAPDSSTVVFDLGVSQPLFEAAIASTYGPLIVNAERLRDRDEMGDWGHAWAKLHEEGCGCGPYRIVRFDPGQELIMERYDDYWRGWEDDHFERIVLQAVPENEARRQLIEQGNVDIVDTLTPEATDALKEDPALLVLEQETTQVEYLAMAVAGPLEQPEARRAMCYAFPYEDVIDKVYGGLGQPAHGAVAEKTRGFEPTTFQYETDLDQAREHLEAIGVEHADLTIAIETGDETLRATAQLFQANLAEVGINLVIEQYETTGYIDLIYGATPVEERPNFMRWAWWPDYNDAWSHLFPQVSCEQQIPAGSNIGFYCNQQVEALLLRAKEATDQDQYSLALAEVQQLLSEIDPPAIYYAQPVWTTVSRADVAGMVINPINIGTFNFWKLRRAVGS